MVAGFGFIVLLHAFTRAQWFRNDLGNSALGGTARPIATSIGGGDISHDGKHVAYLRTQEGQIELAIARSRRR